MQEDTLELYPSSAPIIGNKVAKEDLTPAQREIFEGILSWLDSVAGKDRISGKDQVRTLSGYAGTGKTTLIACLLGHIHAQLNVVAATLTGKAAAQLRLKLLQADVDEDCVSVSTIHSLCYYPIEDDRGAIIGWRLISDLGAPNLIIIDESSMVPDDIYRDLLSYRKPILFIGDAGQLPPVGEKSSIVSKADWMLTEVHRQALDSPIIRLSMAIRKQETRNFKQENDSRVLFYPKNQASIFNSKLIRKASDAMDAVTICRFNRSRKSANQSVRRILKLIGAPQDGEILICLKNFNASGRNTLDCPIADRVYNGDRGYVHSMQDSTEHFYNGAVNFPDRRFTVSNMFMNKEQFQAAKTFDMYEGLECQALRWGDVGRLFDFGYALTAHKAQGSTIPHVAVITEKWRGESKVEWSQWLYTAVTRASETLHIFGDL